MSGSCFVYTSFQFKLYLEEIYLYSSSYVFVGFTVKFVFFNKVDFKICMMVLWLFFSETITKEKIFNLHSLYNFCDYNIFFRGVLILKIYEVNPFAVEPFCSRVGVKAWPWVMSSIPVRTQRLDIVYERQNY